MKLEQDLHRRMYQYCSQEALPMFLIIMLVLCFLTVALLLLNVLPESMLIFPLFILALFVFASIVVDKRSQELTPLAVKEAVYLAFGLMNFTEEENAFVFLQVKHWYTTGKTNEGIVLLEQALQAYKEADKEAFINWVRNQTQLPKWLKEIEEKQQEIKAFMEKSANLTEKQALMLSQISTQDLEPAQIESVHQALDNTLKQLNNQN